MVKASLCRTYGCTLPDKHRGLHSLPPVGKRRATVTTVITTVVVDDCPWKRATLPNFCTTACTDERGDVLVQDPCADYIATGRRSPPPSPHPMREPPREISETSRTASPTPSDLKMMLGLQPSPRSIIETIAEALWLRADTPPCVITNHSNVS